MGRYPADRTGRIAQLTGLTRMSVQQTDTIAAIATPPGQGGVGIVRISGPAVGTIAQEIIGKLPTPRQAIFSRFVDGAGGVIDSGIAIYFPAPNSFSGEDTLELQGHGGVVVLDLLLQRVLELGARLAHAGEFSQRAFCNGKLDLAQAEAIADLIESGTATAARLAMRSLEGEFSRRIYALVEQITQLRMLLEAALDFPEEEIDFCSNEQVNGDLQALQQQLAAVQQAAQTGRLMRDGITLVIAGLPNVGKSSLMNALAGWEAAIVTSIPGTTRDLLHERVQLDGVPLYLVDTAGLRDSSDAIEQEGVRRARAELESADHILWVYDDELDPGHAALDRNQLPPQTALTLIRNKIDLTGEEPTLQDDGTWPQVSISAQSGAGIDLLREQLRRDLGLHTGREGEFVARRRHLDALQRAAEALLQGGQILQQTGAAELVAEELRQAQQALSEITGEVTTDDLLGRIFSDFCIGK